MAAHGAPLDRGYRLGKYEVIGRLSVGGMAELYLAVLAGQGGFKKFVALKRVLPLVAQEEAFLEMFLDEARITASLSHANIAQVFELAEDPDNREPVLAMEFVAGQNVSQIIKRAHDRNLELPVGFACRIIHDALLGLHSAHQFTDPITGAPMPVIHRDVNPRNIMVTYTGGTKVIDFGIAKARGRLNSTQVGTVKGTLRYMSPEQVLFQKVDGRSDLFAASSVLYELLSGLRLFDEPTDSAVIQRVAKGDVPPLQDVMPSLPPALLAALSKGLARDPAARWASGRDYARALDQAVPELFDDAEMAELMGRLFEDRIAVTRALLQSTSTDASYANLELMKAGQDDGGSQPRLAPEPIGDVPTVRVPAMPDVTAPSMPPVAQAPAPPALGERPPAGAEQPTVQARRNQAESTAATIVVSAPVPQAPAPVRRPTNSVPAQATRKRTAEAQPLEPIEDAPPSEPGSIPRAGWLVLVVVVLVALALATLALLQGAGSAAPEDLKPVPALKPKR